MRIIPGPAVIWVRLPRPSGPVGRLGRGSRGLRWICGRINCDRGQHIGVVRLGLWGVCMRRHRPFLGSRLKGGAGEGCAVEPRLSGPAGSSLRQLGVLREVVQCLQASTGGTG
jgi:hypothetical protein